MASFIAERRYLGYDHPKGVAVDLRGTGTSWGQSTTFTPSGVTGASVLTKIVNSATSARLVIATPAAPAGSPVVTLTITDGGTGGTGATATITVKGIHRTRWFSGLSRR